MYENYERKRQFVEEYLKPLLMAADDEITEVVYNCENYHETVRVYEGDCYREACVNLDSNMAIVKDTIRQIYIEHTEYKFRGEENDI